MQVEKLREDMQNMRVEYMKTNSKSLISLIEQDGEEWKIPEADKLDLIKDLKNMDDMALGDAIQMPGDKQMSEESDEEVPVQKKKQAVMMWQGFNLTKIYIHK